MLTRVRNFLHLLFSDEPRDRIRLHHRIQEQPVIGSVYRGWRALRARWSQRTPDDYAAMQKRYYEQQAAADEVQPGEIDGDYVVGSWREHNEWADYEQFLMKYVPRDASWVALDFGCGPGRNLRRWSSLFARIDGVDISAKNLENARTFLADLPAEKQPNLYLTEGLDCGDAPTNAYDFVFSTICL